MTRRHVLGLGLTVGLMVVASAAPTVAAVSADGGFARINDGGARGLVVARYTGTTSVNAGVLGLVASTEYFLVGRSIRCSGTPSAANRVFSVARTTDAGGNLFFSAPVSIGGPVRSFWLGSNDALGAPVCSLSLNFEKYKTTVEGISIGSDLAGNQGPDGVLAMTRMGPTTLTSLAVIVRGPDGLTRLRMVLNGLTTGHDYRVAAGASTCRERLSGIVLSQAIYSPASPSWFLKAKGNVTPARLAALRSLRVVDSTAGSRWGCAPLRFFFNIEALP
jgi:hypothetical protein